MGAYSGRAPSTLEPGLRAGTVAALPGGSSGLGTGEVERSGPAGALWAEHSSRFMVARYRLDAHSAGQNRWAASSSEVMKPWSWVFFFVAAFDTSEGGIPAGGAVAA